MNLSELYEHIYISWFAVVRTGRSVTAVLHPCCLFLHYKVGTRSPPDAQADSAATLDVVRFSWQRISLVSPAITAVTLSCFCSELCFLLQYINQLDLSCVVALEGCLVVLAKLSFCQFSDHLRFSQKHADVRCWQHIDCGSGYISLTFVSLSATHAEFD